MEVHHIKAPSNSQSSHERAINWGLKWLSPNEDRRVYMTKSQQRCNSITPIVDVSSTMDAMELQG